MLLDGRHDRAAIVEALIEPVTTGKVEARVGGEPLTDPKRIRSILTERVEDCFRDFAHHALLIEAI